MIAKGKRMKGSLTKVSLPKHPHIRGTVGIPAVGVRKSDKGGSKSVSQLAKIKDTRGITKVKVTASKSDKGGGVALKSPLHAGIHASLLGRKSAAHKGLGTGGALGARSGLGGYKPANK